MTRFVTSADGTRIAYDRLGAGPPLVIIGGILCDRQRTRPLAGKLAQTFTVIDFDRRGRGESEAGGPYDVRREVEDVAALVREVGTAASLYGHSSGAALAAHAAASGLPVARLVLHEPPYGADDDESVRRSRGLAESVRDAIAGGDHEEAISLFLTAAGLPPGMVAEARRDPALLAMAPTMVHDLLVVGDLDSGGTVPVELIRSISAPTLVVLGSDSPAFFHEAARRLVDLLPRGELSVLDGQDHGADVDAVVPVVTSFLTVRSRGGE